MDCNPDLSNMLEELDARRLDLIKQGHLRNKRIPVFPNTYVSNLPALNYSPKNPVWCNITPLLERISQAHYFFEDNVCLTPWSVGGPAIHLANMFYSKGDLIFKWDLSDAVERELIAGEEDIRNEGLYNKVYPSRLPYFISILNNLADKKTLTIELTASQIDNIPLEVMFELSSILATRYPKDSRTTYASYTDLTKMNLYNWVVPSTGILHGIKTVFKLITPIESTGDISELLKFNKRLRWGNVINQTSGWLECLNNVVYLYEWKTQKVVRSVDLSDPKESVNFNDIYIINTRDTK